MTDPEEPGQESPWHARKLLARQRMYEALTKPPEADPPPMIPEPSGDATDPDVPSEARSALAAASRRLASTATSAMDTAPPPPTPRSGPSPSGTPAPNTPPSSGASTVWAMNPVGFLEANWSPNTVDRNGSLVPGLPRRVRSSLQALATGRGEPVSAVIQAIVEFYVEAEDDRCEGTLLDILEHYIDNQLA